MIPEYDTCDICDEKRPDIVIKEEESRLRICPDCDENYPLESIKDKFLHEGAVLQLRKEDQQSIEVMSSAICNQDRSYFIDNYKRDKTMKLHEMNLNGFGAELAFCRLCSIEFDSSTDQKENHFKKVDATLKDGRTVDVKNTIYPRGKLLVRIGKEEKYVDIYVLVIGKFPVFKFSGWVDYKEIIQPELIKDLGTGDSYRLSQNRLNKILKIN